MRCATPVAALCGVLGVLGSLGSSRASRTRGPSVVTRHMVCHMVFEGPYSVQMVQPGAKEFKAFLQATTHVWLKSQGLKAALRGHPPILIHHVSAFHRQSVKSHASVAHHVNNSTNPLGVQERSW
ncbi:hypothetical protein E4U34_000789 [Claviceps purpurea]|nr:hypothetical protein E4U34_000789 [Claviceps purpurea]KAG6224115.1 hypothetical protein E4U26_003969 [Claviceps purpurea]